jgi:hypothetical protein
MEDDEACNTSLRLGLGSGDYVPRKEETRGDDDDDEEEEEEEEERGRKSLWFA